MRETHSLNILFQHIIHDWSIFSTHLPQKSELLVKKYHYCEASCVRSVLTLISM